MSAAPALAAARPVHAHVAYLRIPGFESLPAAGQAQRKQRLEDAVLESVAPLPVHERIVLDAEDGFALVLFGDAEDALDAAQRVRERARDVQVGLNAGPLAVTSQASDARVYGDGLSAASAAARFAEDGKLFVTEGFARALRESSPGRARELGGAGDFTDTLVRMHKFYAPDPRLRTVRLRRIALYAVSGAVAILLIGVIGRDLYQPLAQSRPALYALDVKPRAEVFVDGRSVGRTPPLLEIALAPGVRRLAFRQPGYRPVELTVEVKPGEPRSIAQTLQKLPEPKPDLWRDLKKKFGS